MKKIIILVLALVPALSWADTTTAPRTLTADLPTAGINRVTLSVSVGEVHVTTSPDEVAHVQVTLKQKEREFLWFFHWMSEGTTKDIDRATINQQKQGDGLALSLNYPGDSDNSEVKQIWQVQIPARLMLKAGMKVGELTIDGVAGGVDATLDVGELSINVPRGPIRGDVNVGEVHAVTGTASPGRLSVSSTIGEAVLYVNGVRSGFHDHSGLGNQVTADGSGPDNASLSVNVGEAMLKVGTATDAKSSK